MKRDYTFPLLSLAVCLIFVAAVVLIINYKHLEDVRLAAPPSITAADADMMTYTEHTFETDDTTFFNGERLFPDKMHSDTLEVVDAAYINHEIQSPTISSWDDIKEIILNGTKSLDTTALYDDNVYTGLKN